MGPELQNEGLDVQTWLNRLSENQLQTIKPIISALDNLLSLSKAEQNNQEEEKARDAAPPTAAEPLAFLETQLQEALVMEDPQAVRELLAKCLEIVRSEKIRLAAASISTSGGSSTVDSTTGLPSRLMFERSVTDGITEGRDFLVALFVVERLAFINKRFGRTTGDRILLFVAQYLAQELPDSSSLSRWSGPAFAVNLATEYATSEKQIQLKTIASKPLSTNIDVGGRNIMVSVNCSCLIETLSADSSPEATFEKLDSFISAHLGR